MVSKVKMQIYPLSYRVSGRKGGNMSRLETYKVLSKKVNRFIEMIQECIIFNKIDIALWNRDVICYAIDDYYRLGKISFVAKKYFENRVADNFKRISNRREK